MYVEDIIDDAVEITGLCEGDILYRRISRAIKVLSRKANFDSLQQHLDINVQSGNIVTLPREVEVPIKININKNPAFTRSTLYEFSMNGPGDDDSQFVGWQWADRPDTPIMATLPKTGAILHVISDAADDGAVIRFYGLDKDNNEISDVLTLNSGADVHTANAYAVMRRVRKDTTTKKVVVNFPNGDAVASYYADETEPKYRQIKLSKEAAQVHILFRSKTLNVRTRNDYIPLDSDTAILLMLRAQQKSESDDGAGIDEAAKLEAQAVKYLQEAQAIRNTHLAAAQDTLPSALNLNINNRDSVIVADVYDEAAAIFGAVGRQKLFDKITEAVELLNRKYPAWRGTDGYIDLQVCGENEVTLPRYIEQPIAINYGCQKLEMRNRWFEFHLNGPSPACPTSCRHWDDVGIVVAVNDPDTCFRLVAINDLDVDNGATVTVYGYDKKGRFIRSQNNGVWQDGVTLTASNSNALPSTSDQVFHRITRITRDVTQGFQQLLAFSLDFNTTTLIGYYYPDETEPNYSRIRLPGYGQYWAATSQGLCGNPSSYRWVRMRYRKRVLKVSALTDQLHLRSRTSIVDAMRALKFYDKPDPVQGKAYEELAVSRLREEEAATNPAETFSFSFTPGSVADPDQGQY